MSNQPPSGVKPIDPLTLQGLIAYGKTAGNPNAGAVPWHMCNLIKQMVPYLEELAEIKGDFSVWDARYNGKRGSK